MRKNTEQNILRGVSKFHWENARKLTLKKFNEALMNADTRPPREREPGPGLELTPKSYK
jgi:hypothetical protein